MWMTNVCYEQSFCLGKLVEAKLTGFSYKGCVIQDKKSELYTVQPNKRAIFSEICNIIISAHTMLWNNSMKSLLWLQRLLTFKIC